MIHLAPQINIPNTQVRFQAKVIKKGLAPALSLGVDFTATLALSFLAGPGTIDLNVGVGVVAEG